MFSEQQKGTLLKVAVDSIDRGLKEGFPLSVRLSDFESPLIQFGACFVTLLLDQKLRGSMGMFAPRQPIVRLVAQHAFVAAFLDRRFTPVTEMEFPHLQIEITMVHPPQSLPCSSEAELLGQLRPGLDGLILLESGHTATFLPNVWSSCPDPHQFLAELKQKAGLPPNYWSDTMRFQVYSVEVL